MLSLRLTPGSIRTREPVAMMALSNRSVVVPPSRGSTSSVWEPLKRPWPSIWVILFLRIRKSTPRTRASATSRLRDTGTGVVEVDVTADTELVCLVGQDGGDL